MSVLRWGSATDVGMVRESNQDSFLVAEPLFAVADGMGGHLGGEVASAMALEILEASFAESRTRDDLLEAVRRANAKVWDKAQLDDNLHGMGTTLTALARIRDDNDSEHFAVINVGDSRGYLMRDGELSQLTEDHSLVEEMVRTGQISAEDAETHPRRNILLRAIGVEPTVEVDLQQLDCAPGDRVLLCSDGLVREVTDDQIAAVLRRLKNPDEAARELVNLAKAHGGHDNITVVLVDIEEDGETPVTLNLGARAEKQPSQAKKGKKSSKPKGPKTPAPKNHGRLTFRMLLFFTAVVALVVVASGSVVWYARASYFVKLDGEQLVIYRGRPEPVLWFKPTVLERTNVSTSQVLPSALSDLRDGETVSSAAEARTYINNLTSEAAAARQAVEQTAVTPSTSSTVAPRATPNTTP